MRGDFHSPGAIVPADYSFVMWYALATTINGWPQPSMGVNCELDKRHEVGDKIVNGAHAEEGGCCIIGLRNEKWAATGNTGNCSVCGAYFVYGEVWKHEPSGEHIHLGHTCADKYGMLANLSDLEAWRREQSDRRAVALLKKEREAAQAAFLEARPGLGTALELGVPSPLTGEQAAHRGPRDILWDLADRLGRYGTLTDKQVALAFRLAEEIRNPPPPEEHVPAPTGRVSFEGEVVMVKEYESNYGESWKMIVKVPTLTGSWSCFVSVPRSIMDHYMGDLNYDQGVAGWLKGKKVELTATLTLGREPHFAFGKRPTGARIL